MKTPIDIEIPICLPQHPWHPSVVYVPNGWNGHRYWMAETPYPPFDVAPYKDRWELPCVHYSDDGLHWKSIDANPIDDLTEEQIASHSYHSDTHLVMNDGVLYCYYRLMEDHDERTTIIRKSSIDGIHWSEREIITLEETKTEIYTASAAINIDKEDEVIKNAHSTSVSSDSPHGLECNQPQVLTSEHARASYPHKCTKNDFSSNYSDALALQSANAEAGLRPEGVECLQKNVTFDNCEKNEKKCHADSREIISPAVVWTGERWRMYYVDDTYTNLNRGIQLAESEDGIHFTVVGSVWKQQEVKPWHIDVQLIDGVYYLLVHDVDHKQLVLYQSEDGIHFEEGKKLLHASCRLYDFWSNQLYRACLVKIKDKIQIYFSAHDGTASYIGVMQQSKNGEYYVVDCLSGIERIRFVLYFWGRRCKQFVQRIIRYLQKRL